MEEIYYQLCSKLQILAHVTFVQKICDFFLFALLSSLFTVNDDYSGQFLVGGSMGNLP